jgi:tyrosyl-tRNA synthetase
VGFDPSASSLHVGNLLPLICLLHFKQTGHHALALVCEVRDTETNKAHGIFSIKIGGATGFIGDPSGRSSERQALDPDQLAHNVKGITAQVNSFFERGHKYARKRGAGTAQRGALDILNNLDWTGEITLLDFLKGVGKRSKVNAMLARDR